MRSLSPRDLLEIWERGVGQRPLQRALELLAAACLEDSPEALAALTIGERDGILLTLRESTFGPEMAGLISCVRCNTQLELTFKATDLRPACVATPESEFSMSIAGYELRFRLPDSLDLSVVAAAEFPRSRRMLLDRCMLAACRDGLPTTSDQLPEEVVDAVAQRMAEADPLAEVQLAISCTTCGHRWPATFDIVAFFWNEIETWARRLLSEVHILAAAYNWRERDILALTPMRRQFYLEMVGA